MNEDEQEAGNGVHPTKWLEDFLREKFFYPCFAHPNQRNVLNMFCVDCNFTICPSCKSSGDHSDHQIITIVKNNRKEAVRVTDMVMHIDCSEIQPFICNGHWVLYRLPRCGSTLNDEASCNNGSRKLEGSKTYQYCSISCKVKAMLRKSDDSVPPIISIQASPPPPPQEPPGETANPSKRKRKRKGIPHRFPYFRHIF